MEHRSLRLLRGWLGALAATTLAAASHTLAGGSLPAPQLLVLVLALSAAVCTALSGRGLSLARTSLAVAFSQGLYHLSFGWGHAADTGARYLPPTGASEHATHAAHGIGRADWWSVSLTARGLGPDAASGPGSPAEATWMPVAHLAAALLTIAILRRGELALRTLAEMALLAAPIAVLRWKPAPAVVRVLLPAPAQVPGLPDLGVPLRALRRRGPPACPAS